MLAREQLINVKYPHGCYKLLDNIEESKFSFHLGVIYNLVVDGVLGAQET